MNLAFLLHIYQPFNQEQQIVKSISASSYIPLVKFISQHRSARFTLNIPLSLSFQLDQYGYSTLIKDIRDLYDQEKIELTSCAAYHCLLPKTKKDIGEKQILLNEYALGYYFGKDKGFEGEDALLLKNVNGFFPPELAVNQDIVSNLESLGYQWVLADECAFSQYDEYNPVYYYKNLDIKVVCRNTQLSNMLSFKRDANTEDFIDKVLELRQEGKDAVVALDGEYFGHHNKDGMFLLETLIQQLIQLDINVTTVSSLIEDSEEKDIDMISESTWGATKKDVSEGKPYPLWFNKNSLINQTLWELTERLSGKSEEFTNEKFNHQEMLNTFPIWDLNKVANLDDESLISSLNKEIMYLQCFESDQYWWSSDSVVFDTNLHDNLYIEKMFEHYKKFAQLSSDGELSNFIEESYKKIKSVLV